MIDRYDRSINYMRISVTDKCNLRCSYCMPDGVKLLPMEDLLTIEEITAITRQAVKLGIDKVKITGGEPLVKRGVIELFRQLKGLAGLSQVTMTTNGVLLEKYLPDLISIGIDGINISLDTLDKEQYLRITGSDKLQNVLESISSAVEAGIRVKINTVLIKGQNDDQWEQILELARTFPVDVRFIELMPIGEGALLKGVSNPYLFSMIRDLWPDMRPDMSVHGNGPAVYYNIPGFMGSIGFISAMHGRFCDSCNRVRLNAVGELKPCLCYSDCIDLKTILRREGEDAVYEAMENAIYNKPEKHCFEASERITETRRMSSIGG